MVHGYHHPKGETRRDNLRRAHIHKSRKFIHCDELSNFQSFILCFQLLLKLILLSTEISFFFSVFSSFGLTTFVSKFFQSFFDLIFYLLICKLHRHYTLSLSSFFASFIAVSSLWLIFSKFLIRSCFVISWFSILSSRFLDSFSLFLLVRRFWFSFKLRQVYFFGLKDFWSVQFLIFCFYFFWFRRLFSIHNRFCLCLRLCFWFWFSLRFSFFIFYNFWFRSCYFLFHNFFW